MRSNYSGWDIKRTASTFLALAALGFCWYYEITHPHRVPAPCKGSVATFTDKQLQSLYNADNESYFYGKLPKVDVRWGNLPVQWSAVTLTRNDGSKIILLDPTRVVTDRNAEEIVLHESCHVKTQTPAMKTDFDIHGTAFQSCMRDLANRGALDNVW